MLLICTPVHKSPQGQMEGHKPCWREHADITKKTACSVTTDTCTLHTEKIPSKYSYSNIEDMPAWAPFINVHRKGSEFCLMTEIYNVYQMSMW